MALKEQLQGLLRDNHILKRAVAIQHERQLEHEERSRELEAVKQLLTQHQEQLRSLEVRVYLIFFLDLIVNMLSSSVSTCIPECFALLAC